MTIFSEWSFWVVLFFFFSGIFLFYRIPTLGKFKSNSEAEKEKFPRISIIIPARNEAKRIGRLLDSITKQTISDVEVLVINDESTDHTAEIVASKGFKVIHSEPLPQGWTGKSWACWQGAHAATGEILVFLDADLWLHPNFLEKLAEQIQHRRGLISIQPYHIVPKAYEQLSAFFNIILMAGLGAFTPLGRNITPGGIFGPCVACTREDYFIAGGHQTSRGAVLEGFPLAAAFKQHGIPIFLFGGRDTLNFRMYPLGLGDLIEGWTKGFGSGAFSLKFPILLLIVGWVWSCFNVFIGLVRSSMGMGFPLVFSVILYALFAIQIGWMLRRIGNFHPLTALLFPIPLNFFALLMLYSLFKIFIRKKVTWRGRDIAQGR